VGATLITGTGKAKGKGKEVADTKGKVEMITMVKKDATTTT
jgi:hypothetical protein